MGRGDVTEGFPEDRTFDQGLVSLLSVCQVEGPLQAYEQRCDSGGGKG